MRRYYSVGALIAVLLIIPMPPPVEAQYGTGYTKKERALLPPVNDAEAQSLVQNNAFNLNVGIQDFTFQFYVVLTNLTQDLREYHARLTDAVHRRFLEKNVLRLFEKVRFDLKTEAEDLTRASLNAKVADRVNNFITQVNNIRKLIDGEIKDPDFVNKSYYRKERRDFLNKGAITEFDRLFFQLFVVIHLHKRAVAAAK